MKNLKNKMKNKKGFTLMEMLIVIAIMVVLMAIALPAFSSQLDGAKKTADDANLRSAKSIAMTAAVTKDTSVQSGMIYDINGGKFVTATAATLVEANRGQSDDYDDLYIVVTIDHSAGTASVTWATATAGTP